MAVLQVKSISKSYKGHPALRSVSLSVEKGDIFGIVGLSGAGKSTLIRTLATLVRPTSGEVVFHGENIVAFRSEQLRQYRKKMGMIFQHFNLLNSRSVGANVAYPLEIANMSKAEMEKRVVELLGLVGLEDKREAFPLALSGGQKQRVGIARALATSPELLLCDEATSALDPKTTKEILALLKKVNQELGVTIVLISHEMEVIKEICNKVAVLDKGEIVEQGLVSEIFAEPKHPMTKHFIRNVSHEIPTEFYSRISPKCKLLILRFKGDTAGEAIITQVIKQFDVEINILRGWIDQLQTAIIGTLIVEVSGGEKAISEALHYFEEKKVKVEEVKP
ncbi:MAG: Methionine import ATP-binding protein MetN [Chlamydiae bacterium]|nr:Methionine import ATP-binding protein MetN [Chlamydiota bacterium]